MNTELRWKQNAPSGLRPRESFVVTVGLLAVVTVLALVVAATARGAEYSRPDSVAVLFTGEGCQPCKQLQADVQSGQLPGWRFELVTVTADGVDRPELLRQFNGELPAGGPIPPDYSGPLDFRPPDLLVPVTWVPGTGACFVGYSKADQPRLRRFLEQCRQRQPGPPVTAPLPEPRPLPNPTPAATARPAAEPTRGPVSTAVVPPDWLQGVRLVLAVPELADQAARLRADLARRAGESLEQLARERLGVQAELVAQVADPDRFERLRLATGDDGRRAVLHVLAPDSVSGVRGLLVQQAEAMLADHFLPSLQRARVNVILQRLHGGTYEAAVAALDGQPAEPPTRSPAEPAAAFVSSAWATERLRFARRLLAYLGLA